MKPRLFIIRDAGYTFFQLFLRRVYAHKLGNYLIYAFFSEELSQHPYFTLGNTSSLLSSHIEIRIRATSSLCKQIRYKEAFLAHV